MLTLGGAAGFAVACGGASDSSTTVTPVQHRTAASIAKYQGDDQAVPPGTKVPIVPAVIVRDANGVPLPGAAVSFKPLSGSGASFSDPLLTDSNGVAAVTSWSSGGTEGVDSLQAEVNATNVPGNPVYFTMRVVSLPPTDIVIVSGDNQSAFSNAIVMNMQVRVMSGNDPVKYQAIQYEATKGGGYSVGSTGETDQSGFATVYAWRLGKVPGPNELTVSVLRDSQPPLTAVFHATGLLVPPRSISVLTGLGQTAAPGTPVAYPPEFLVRDSSDRGVVGAHVRFRATGGGTLSDTLVTTDLSGFAREDVWTLGLVQGTDTLFASVADSTDVPVPSANITARSIQRTTIPASVRFIGARTDTDTVGHAVSFLPSVAVRDSNGFGISGMHILFQALDGGSIAGNQAVTDTGGVATAGQWTLGPLPEFQGLDASLTDPGVPPLSTGIVVLALPAEPTAVEIVSGDNQSAAVGSAVPLNPTVVVHTDKGDPVVGVRVLMYPEIGSGHVPNEQVYTDSLGHASVGPWILGSPGTNTLTVRLDAIGTLQFHATGH